MQNKNELTVARRSYGVLAVGPKKLFAKARINERLFFLRSYARVNRSYLGKFARIKNYFYENPLFRMSYLQETQRFAVAMRQQNPFFFELAGTPDRPSVQQYIGH